MTTPLSDRPRSQWFERTVPRLATLGRDRYHWLAHNPEHQPPHELTQHIPEINEIELDNSQSQATAREGLHVAAWNLERGRHWREAAQLLQAHPGLQSLDILCLSEMDDGMARSHNEHSTRELALALGMNYAYGVEFLELSLGTPEEQAQTQGDNDRGYHGNAILSRLPLQSPRLLRLPGGERWYDAAEKRLGGRIALFADIQLGAQVVTVVSTHLESGPENQQRRTQEGQLILQAIATHYGDRPIILGGDLNAAPTTPVIQALRAAGFAVEESNDLTVSTYQLQVNGRIQPGKFHIDYVLTRGLAVAQAPPPAVIMAAYPCEPTGKMLSDHAIATTHLRLCSSVSR